MHQDSRVTDLRVMWQSRNHIFSWGDLLCGNGHVTQEGRLGKDRNWSQETRPSSAGVAQPSRQSSHTSMPPWSLFAQSDILDYCNFISILPFVNPLCWEIMCSFCGNLNSSEFHWASGLQHHCPSPHRLPASPLVSWSEVRCLLLVQGAVARG